MEPGETGNSWVPPGTFSETVKKTDVVTKGSCKETGGGQGQGRRCRGTE